MQLNFAQVPRSPVASEISGVDRSTGGWFLFSFFIIHPYSISHTQCLITYIFLDPLNDCCPHSNPSTWTSYSMTSTEAWSAGPCSLGSSPQCSYLHLPSGCTDHNPWAGSTLFHNSPIIWYSPVFSKKIFRGFICFSFAAALTFSKWALNHQVGPDKLSCPSDPQKSKWVHMCQENSAGARTPSHSQHRLVENNEKRSEKVEEWYWPVIWDCCVPSTCSLRHNARNHHLFYPSAIRQVQFPDTSQKSPEGETRLSLSRYKLKPPNSITEVLQRSKFKRKSSQRFPRIRWTLSIRHSVVISFFPSIFHSLLIYSDIILLLSAQRFHSAAQVFQSLGWDMSEWEGEVLCLSTPILPPPPHQNPQKKPPLTAPSPLQPAVAVWNPDLLQPGLGELSHLLRHLRCCS